MTENRGSMAAILSRRLPILVLVALALWLFRGSGPHEVALTWVLPADPPTTQARVALVDDDGTVATSLAWGTAHSPAAARQVHRANLAPGAYRIQALLLRADGSTADVQRELVIDPEDDAISIHLD